MKTQNYRQSRVFKKGRKPAIRFDIITIFPESFNSYLFSSIIGRAVKKRLIRVNLHNLRKWAKDKRGTVDDKPYSGGPGMILKIEPIYKAIKALTRQPTTDSDKVVSPRCRRNRAFSTKSEQSRDNKQRRIILLSAKGKQFTQKDARRLAKYRQLILISGHYEGIDERVKKYLADEELSVGRYVLTGGELPAMIVIDACSRLIPGVLGKQESLRDESFSKENYLEYPQYTRPEIFSPARKFPEFKAQNSKLKSESKKSKFKKKEEWKVPKILLSGDHKKINAWREKNAKILKK